MPKARSYISYDTHGLVIQGNVYAALLRKAPRKRGFARLSVSQIAASLSLSVEILINYRELLRPQV